MENFIIIFWKNEFMENLFSVDFGFPGVDEFTLDLRYLSPSHHYRLFQVVLFRAVKIPSTMYFSLSK